MTLKKYFAFCLLLLCQYICAQQDTIIKLEEVLISDHQLKDFSDSQSVSKLTDSVIVKNRTSLTSLLNYNSVIYFKENGLGMVSSPSFRGTTAQQTAVIWNGININSQLNGQTDFNTLSAKDFNSVSIRSGGGSAIYGSSAMGGSVHLNTDLSFVNKFDNTIQVNYGSFNTLAVNYKVKMAVANFSTQISVSHISSDNDYAYLDTDKKNENGQFENTSLNVSLGYKIDSKNSLKFYSYLFDGDRHFSGTLAAPSQSKYLDLNSRNLLEWSGHNDKVKSNLKLAFLSEKYTYFENAATSVFSYGSAKTLTSKYDLLYKINAKIELNSILDYTHTRGLGSDIGKNDRETASGVLLLKHKLFSDFLYEIAVRKEISNVYASPVLFSVGTNYSPFSFYQFKINGSRNFRVPTFNDLYWQGSGNLELKPESSYQLEVGHAFAFKNTTLSITNYYSKIQDLILWSPSANGNWRPNNIGKVSTYGAEILFNYSKKSAKNKLDFTATYAYTISEDEVKKKQLIYVPFHKFTASLAYSIDKFTAHYQYLYNGKVFTSSDNFYSLNDYLVSNLGINYQVGKKKFLQVGFDILNLFNENYQSVSMRPLPGRNYSINLIFNF
ncbi:TonB-dependent receptor plug domain-containing protein [Flavobacterium cellulosilyticum]|uniref:TonB-dependent receptor n=1 Tax=Flavobacterium cellulosilyticum TaxID=2541731 RepID=A0A4R5CJ29_9FLAO|nr:TonB-dependent receptor [Flavobacterium cellulosilyticum]TDD97354.1 TonB-dependent receptor [Flavobacterium cellulosilyticum]